MKKRDMKLDEINRRGFLKAMGAGAATAAAPSGTLKALATPDTSAAMSDLRQALAYEIRIIYDLAADGRDQTDHIIDDLGDLWNDIEDSGDEVALEAYTTMMDTLDEGPETQAAAAEKAIKMLEKGVISGAASQALKSTAATAARSQAVAAGTASVAAFKDLVQRVMSAGRATQPPTKDTGRIEPAGSAPALPAPDTDNDIMAKLRDIVGRNLTPQELQIVDQEIEKTKN